MDTRTLKREAGIEPYRSRLTLEKSGNSFLASCPWHPDRTPSLSIFEKDGEWLFNCFGASCCEKGDVISFVQKEEGVGFSEAKELIAQECEMESESQGREQRQWASSSIKLRRLLT